MRTNRSAVLLLLAAALCGFFFGLGRHQVMAWVYNCPSSPCENEYAWWAGGPGTTCFTAQVPGSTWPMGMVGTQTAIPGIFVPSPSGTKTPLVATGDTYDRWTWPDNTATCRNMDNSWPFPQEVIESGVPSLPEEGKGLTRNKCTPGP